MNEPKRILCYGDSNTWGFIPGTQFHRYEPKERWTTILQKSLGNNFEVIVEGLNGRTITSEDPRPNMIGRNGSTYLVPCLDSHDPLDLVIVMLGTTELKEMFHNTPEHVGETLEKYFVKVILNKKSQFRDTIPKLCIISPPIVNEKTEFASQLFKGAAEKSRKLNMIYKNIAERNKCHFIDAKNIDVGTDGIHLTKKGNKELAEIILKEIKSILL